MRACARARVRARVRACARARVRRARVRACARARVRSPALKIIGWVVYEGGRNACLQLFTNCLQTVYKKYLGYYLADLYVDLYVWIYDFTFRSICDL